MHLAETNPTLPKLRKDILITEGGLDYNRTPTWVIQDPINNKFYHIGWLEHEILSNWRSVPYETFINEFNATSLKKIDLERLEKFILFLSKNCLIHQPYEAINDLYQEQQKHQAKKYSAQWWIQNYLFIRIPLIKPDKFLTQSYRAIKGIFTWKFAGFMLVMAILGLILVGREWSNFTSTFFNVFSTKYFIVFFIALSIAKVLHELGHAYACKKYGLRVPAIGVAFLVMFPMLYTDTSESWKIKEPRRRLHVSIAGVVMETYLAIIALWLWLFLPQGMLKSICFFLATYSLFTTILINISPFLRFDGYHILSDMMKMRNLQTRAFALTQWWVRSVLLGIDEPAPEKFRRHKRKALYIYAICTWIYRFVLFIGIAVLVYYFFFKALGIILFIVEIYHFILRPIINELKVWWEKRSEISWNKNTILWSFGAIVLLFLIFYPWRSHIKVPATFEFKTSRYYLDMPSYVEKINIHRDQSVKKGDALVQFHSPLLDFQIEKTKLMINEINWKLRNIGTSNEDPSQKTVLEYELSQYQTKEKSLIRKRDKLNVIAPFDGKVVGIRKGLNLDTWAPKNQAILLLLNPKIYSVKAYADAYEKSLLHIGESAKFIPDDPQITSIMLTLKNIDYQQEELINLKPEENPHNLLGINSPAIGYHLSSHGGPIAVRETQGGYETEESVYTIEFDVDKTLPSDYTQTISGEVVLEGQRESIAYTIYKQIAALLIRESSF